MTRRLLYLPAWVLLLLCVAITASHLYGVSIGIHGPRVWCEHKYATVIGNGDNSYHRGMQGLLYHYQWYELTRDIVFMSWQEQGENHHRWSVKIEDEVSVPFSFFLSLGLFIAGRAVKRSQRARGFPIA